MTKPVNQTTCKTANQLNLPKGAINLAKRVAGLAEGDYVILVKRSMSGVSYDVLVSTQSLGNKKG